MIIYTSLTTPATNIITYFKLVDPSTGVPETALTIANLDATYVRDGASAVKNDLSTPGGYTVTSAHTDNAAIVVDATNAPGLYRVDWPDAAFVAGVSRVQLCINGAAIDPAYIEVELMTPVAEYTIATVSGAVGSVVGNVAQTGDSYAVVTNVTYGLSAIENLVDDIGASGAGLTSIPWNAAWDTEVESEVTDALNAYDGPTNTELSTALASADDAVLAAIVGLNDVSASDIISALETEALPDSVAIDGQIPTWSQAMYAIHQWLFERAVSGTTMTVYKPDGTTALMTFTLNDATSPTEITRAS